MYVYELLLTQSSNTNMRTTVTANMNNYIHEYSITTCINITTVLFSTMHTTNAITFTIVTTHIYYSITITIKFIFEIYPLLILQ